MSSLHAFLNPVITREEKEIIISNRFQDENGKPVPFKIRSLTQEENELISKKSKKSRKENGKTVTYTDMAEFSRRVIVEATITPDFRSTEMCEAYGVLDPLLVPGKMLFSGEFSALLEAITELSGFSDPEDVDEAKN